MRDPFRRLIARLDGGPVTLAAGDRHDLDEDGDALVGAGVLVATAPATVVPCDSCDDPHFAEVFSFAEDGFPTRWFARCPAFGSVPVAPESLRQWAVNPAALGRADRPGRRGTGARSGVAVGVAAARLGGAGRVAGGRVARANRDRGRGAGTAVAERGGVRAAPPAAARRVGRSLPSLVVPLADVLRSTGTGVELDRTELVTFLPPEPVVVVEPADTRPRLLLPAGARWEDVTLIVGNSDVELVLGVERHRIGYDDLGLADGRNGGPSGAWKALVYLAAKGELAPTDGIRAKSGTLKNNVVKLRDALRHWTGLGEPFHPVLPQQPYRLLSRVRPAETL